MSNATPHTPPTAPLAAPPAAPPMGSNHSDRPLGILMLDTHFARPLGDGGNPASWPFPVHIARVPGAAARAVVSGEFRGIETFIAAAESLVEDGACAITTTCGFLARFQHVLADALPVPVETSTLMHYPALQAALPAGKQVAILTIDATALDAEVRTAASIPAATPVFSLDTNSHFRRAILDETVALDVAVACSEWTTLTQHAVAQHPEIAHWLLECANLPPYSAAITSATGRPVFDVLTMGIALHQRTNQYS